MSPVELLDDLLEGAASEAALQQVVSLFAGSLAGLSNPPQLRSSGVAARALSGHRVVTPGPDERMTYSTGGLALNGSLLLT